MGWRSKLSGGAEWDAFSRWRRVLGWKPGAIAWIKRAHNKRQRRLAKEMAREQE